MELRDKLKEYSNEQLKQILNSLQIELKKIKLENDKKELMLQES